MKTVFDGVVTPLKIDLSTGDKITPREVRYRFKLMLPLQKSVGRLIR